MKNRRHRIFLKLLLMALSAGIAGRGLHFLKTQPPFHLRPSPSAAWDPNRAQEAYGHLLMAFEPNEGQFDPRRKFLCRGKGYRIFLNATEADLVLGDADPGSLSGGQGRRKTGFSKEVAPVSSFAVLHIGLKGANPGAELEGREKLPGVSNYFIGKDPSGWRTHIAHYARIRALDVYPGIDLEYYGCPGKDRGQLEHDFVVSPKGDPHAIRWEFQGAGQMKINKQGNLILTAGRGRLVLKPPLCYQVLGGQRREVECRYRLSGQNQVGFQVGDYDPTQNLVIDPVLVYSTYLGGNDSDIVFGMAVDGSGNTYLTGETTSSNFPTTPGAFQTALKSGSNAFVTKLNAAGTALVYSTYLGGSIGDAGDGIAVDSDGNAYVGGATGSTDFPTTSGAFQTAFKGPKGATTAFVTKLDPTGSSLAYSTYLGGMVFDICNGIAVDGGGNAYVTGRTFSGDFPTTPGVFQTLLNYKGIPGTGGNAFITKLNGRGSALLYSTYLGGSSTDQANGISLDKAGNVYVTGGAFSTDFPTTAGAFQPASKGTVNAFVSKLNPAGTALAYSTYLGGNQVDIGNGIAVDGDGNAYVTGQTSSGNFPTTAGAFQTALKSGSNAFVTKLNTAGTALDYSSYLGGSNSDLGRGIAVDSNGKAWIVGTTSSTDFPTTGPVQTALRGSGNAFVAAIDPAMVGKASSVFSTYLGGSNADQGTAIALDGGGNAYVTGITNSPDFPTTSGVFQSALKGARDNFYVAKINPSVSCVPSLSLQLKYNSGGNSNTYLWFQYKITNNGSTPVDATKVSFKVWFDNPITVYPVSPTYFGVINSTPPGNTLQETAASTRMGPCGAGNRAAVDEVEVSFAPWAGTYGGAQINAGGDFLSDANGILQLYQTGTNWFNDYSQIPPSQTGFNGDLHYGLYYNGQLVSGNEPCGATPFPTCPPGVSPQTARPFGSLFADQKATATPTVTPTPTPVFNRGGQPSLVAVPNVSKNGEPIQFRVSLGQAAPLRLALYDLSGTVLYKTAVEGQAGENTIIWNLQNGAGQKVASGFYVYKLSVDGAPEAQTKTGKVVVLR